MTRRLLDSGVINWSPPGTTVTTGLRNAVLHTWSIYEDGSGTTDNPYVALYMETRSTEGRNALRYESYVGYFRFVAVFSDDTEQVIYDCRTQGNSQIPFANTSLHGADSAIRVMSHRTVGGTVSVDARGVSAPTWDTVPPTSTVRGVNPLYYNVNDRWTTTAGKTLSKVQYYWSDTRDAAGELVAEMTVPAPPVTPPSPSGRTYTLPPVSPPRPVALDGNAPTTVSETAARVSGAGLTKFWLESATSGRFVDITDMVVAGQWRHGSILPNRIGGAAEGGTGYLMLQDDYGWLSPFNPRTGFNPQAGGRIRIIRDNVRLFTGYSDGVQMTMNRDGRTMQSMSIRTGLSRLSDYGEGVLSRIVGEQPAHTIIQTILEDAGWRGVIDGLNLSTSTLTLRGTRLNGSGIVSNGRRRVRLQDALNAIAVIDGGYLFDTENNVLIYDSGNVRARRARATNSIPADRVIEFAMRPLDTAVVNQIGGENDQFNALARDDVEFTPPLPLNVAVPANSGVTVRLNVSRAHLGLDNYPNAFVGQWGAFTKDTHYTWAGVGSVRFTGASRHCDITITSTSPRSTVFTIRSVSGTVYREALGTRVTARNANSVAQYGVKEAVYDASLLARPADAVAIANQWVQTYGGYPRPIIVCDVTVRNWDAQADGQLHVGDLCNLTLDGWLGKEHCDAFPFWIDAKESQYDSLGNLDTKLTLRAGYVGAPPRA